MTHIFKFKETQETELYKTYQYKILSDTDKIYIIKFYEISNIFKLVVENEENQCWDEVKDFNTLSEAIKYIEEQ